MKTISHSYTKPSSKEIMKFLIPSLIGVVIFLLPISYKGQLNIPIGVVSELLAEIIKPYAFTIVTILVTISALVSLFTTLTKSSINLNNNYINKHFKVNGYYLTVRIIGASIALMCYFNIGPSIIVAEDTGKTMMSLLGTLVAWFFCASFLIPFLMDFGIMEFFGTISRGLTRPLFRIPGMATIDLLASWIGNCNVGVVLTTRQYTEGYYTAREAILISTCFSAVSLPFCLVVAAMLNVENNFIPFYLIICLVGILSVVIMCRIPPLSKYPDEYYPNSGKQIQEDVPKEISKNKWALKLAVDRAKGAPATIAGFADMIIPAILAAGIESYKTRFVIGILSLVQIIYLTEVGTLILTSELPVKLHDLALKTIICIPLIILFTNLFNIG